MSGREVESLYLETLRDVVGAVTIPVALKFGPGLSAPMHMARQFAAAGARGLVLFNRFYQPDFDLERLEVTPSVVFSDSDDLRLPMTWVGLLFGRVEADLALTTGVHTGRDALKAIAAGATVAMMASELIAKGPGRITAVLDEMRAWLTANEYDSLDQLRGSMSQLHSGATTAFERANYMRMVHSNGPRMLSHH